MIPLGLTATQQSQLFTLLRKPHSITQTIRLMDTSHNYISDLSRHFIDGNVSVDGSASTSDRGLDLTLLDPLRAIHLDADSPSPSAVFVTNMLSVVTTVASPDGSQWFNIPVFTGPIDDVQRNGVMLGIKCLGKEVLSSDDMWVGRTWPKNTLKTSIITQLLQAAGETKFSFTPSNARTTAVTSIKKDQKPWIVAKQIAASMGMQLFYDGRGVCRMRPWPNSPALTCDDSVLKTQPQIGYDLKSASNAVEVIGGVPKGSKKPVHYSVVAPDSHPLSPKRVGRNGVPRYLNPIRVNDTNIRTTAKAKALAESLLSSALLESIDTTFDILPWPLLEPMDVVYLNYNRYAVATRANKFTIPLKNNGSTNIGYIRRIKTVGRPAITRRR
jgi:hypothetical protein